MNELKRRVANYGVTVVAGLISCAIVIAPTTEATAQVKQAIPAPGPNPSSAPAGNAFSQDFSKPLDTTLFTEAYGRMEIDTALQPSTVEVSGGRLHIKAGEQNYGDAAVRVNQPFDFADRTGTITFNVNTNQADGWTTVALSELPYPYVSFASDNTFGPFPQEGMLLQFRGNLGCVTIKTYRQGAETADMHRCAYGVKTGPTILNRVSMQISSSQIMVTTDGRKIVFPVSLGFSRGYLYLISHNHATMKYANQPTWDTQWDNLSFDVPAISVTRAALAPFNLPANLANPRLVLMARHDLENRNVTLAYRLNGGPAHSIPLVRRNGQVAVFMISQSVDPGELRAGANTVTLNRQEWGGRSLRMRNWYGMARPERHLRRPLPRRPPMPVRHLRTRPALRARPALHSPKTSRRRPRTRSDLTTAGPVNGMPAPCSAQTGMTGMPTTACRARIPTPHTAPST